MDGALPESTQPTERADPAVSWAAGAGVVNLTSAKAKGAAAARRAKRLISMATGTEAQSECLRRIEEDSNAGTFCAPHPGLGL